MYMSMDSNHFGVHCMVQHMVQYMVQHIESLWTFSSWKLMKITVWVYNTFLSIVTPIFSDLRNLLSLKTPGLDFKAIESEVDENYNMGSEYISKHSDTIFSKKSIKTHCVLGSPTLESCTTGRFLIPLELVSIC